MIDRTCLAVLLGLLGLCSGLQCPKQKVSPGREVVCYTSVSEVDQLTEAICKCTTLVQQGYDVRNLSISEFQDFRKSLKEIIPTLQYVISVDDPGKMLRTSGTVRQEITARLTGILKEVDGIELNMTAGSKERLVHFVKGLKDEMTRKSYDTRIFLVLPTKPEELAKQFDLKELSKYVDLFTIPTHYLVEDNAAYHTFHPSRLMGLFDMYNADSLIDLISGLGVPKKKILMSLPSSAYEFILKDQDDNTPRAPTEEMQPVVINQKQLCDLMNDGEWTVERDEDLTAPYAFKNKMWVAFEDKISVSIKGKYVLLRELPGLGVRDVENDSKTKCGMPLTYEIYNSFTNFKRKSRAAVLNALEDDLHQTELSYPTKVKSSNYRVVRVVDTEGQIRAVRENTQTEFTCSRQGYFVHPKSCNRFYRCVKFNQEIEDYSVFEFDCPAGLAFDETTEVCVWPGSLSQGSPCPGSSEIAPVARVRFECPSTPGYYADPQNPRWFFACIDLGGPHMMAYEFRCPFGLIFDEHKLVCEWPWLVEGYSGSGYTRTEYGGYGTGSTPGTGGYYTGALPHGYTGTTGYQGGYAGSSGFHGSDYSGTGSTSSYPGQTGAGGYSGSVAGHGTGYSGAGTGYSGSTAGHGYSGGVTGSYGGSSGHIGGSTGSGHAGAGYYGSTDGSGGTGYSGTGGQIHGGSGSGVYSGATGSGQVQTGIGHTGAGQTYTGSGSNVYSGATGAGQVHTGTGYSGTGGQTHTGSGSGIYSGATGTGQVHTGTGYSGTGGQTHTGSGSGIYSGTTGSGQVHTGTGYSGTGGQTHTGSGSGIYSGATGTGQVHTGAGFPGTGGQTHIGSGSGIYSGTTGSGQIQTGIGHSGAGQTYTGSGSNVYSGATGSGQVHTGTGFQGAGQTYTGSGSNVYSGATGSGQVHTGTGFPGTGGQTHSGSGIYSGTTVSGQVHTGTGYSGTSGQTHTGSGSGIYSGATGTGQVHAGAGFSGTGGIHTGVVGTGYTGSGSSIAPGHQFPGSTYTGHGSGSTSGGYVGSSGQGGSGIYTGTTAGGHQGTISGYEGSTTSIHGGSGISYTGSVPGGYQGSTGGHGGPGTGYSGSIGGHGGSGTGYSGSTSGVYKETGVQGGSGFTVSTGGSGTSYTGSGVYQGAHGGSGTGYSGSTSGVYKETGVQGGSGFTAGSGTSYTGSGVYQGAHGGSGTGYTGTGGGYQGPSGSGHGTGTGTGYSGSTTGGFAVHGGSGTTYSGSATGSGYQGAIGGHGSTGSGYTGSDGHVTVTEDYSSTGGVKGSGYTISPNGYDTGSYGGSTPGQIFGTGPSQSTVYKVGGTGSGIQYTGGVHGQSPIYVPKPDGPKINCGFSCSDSTQPSGGQTYVTGDYFGSHGVTGSGATVYQGSSGHEGSVNVTLIGNEIPTYHGGVTPGGYGVKGQGTIATGHNVQGSIITGSSSPGTLITHEGRPGTVLSGSSQQGTIVTGKGHPGYVKTSPGSPGYVIDQGVKTVYPGSASPGTSVYGTPSPGTFVTGTPDSGTILHGQTSPGIVLTGQTAPGVTLGGSIDHGTIVGHHGFTQTTQHGYGTKTQSGFDTGYKTNEYHDNGGRGTIKFNNGDVTTKYTENDIPDYRPAGGTIPPDTLFSGGVTGAPGGSTPGGFTKTGPTKTGFTTASLGGGGSYVISTGRPRSKPSSDNIGEKAFEGNVAGYTKSSTESSLNSFTGGARYQGHVDTSKITLGPSKSPGYTYPRPNIPFETGVTSSPVDSEGNIFTTPTPYLNVEIYNTPKFGSSTPGTPTITYQRPSGFVTSTVTPAYTPGSLEQYKTTLFEAAKLPGVTVKPIDSGYYTVSPSSIPVTEDKFSGGVHTGSVYDQTQFGYGTKTSQQKGYVSGTTPPSVFEVKTHPQVNYGSSDFDQQHVTPSSISGSLKPQTQYIPSSTYSPAIGAGYTKPSTPSIIYAGSTPGSISGGSPTNVGISRDDVGKLITNYRGTTKYVPNEYDVYSPGSFTGSSSWSSKQGYTSTPSSIIKTQSPFAVTTYPGGYSRPTSISTYQSTAKSTAVGKGKVIVKWSDLHPLLLGKLGAECTCRGDPFANLRGPGSKLINSSKGKVDLSNYDDSEIYVDLEKDNSNEENDYVTTYESSSKKPIKVWNELSEQIKQRPSSTYLPSVTPSINVGHGFTANYRAAKSLDFLDARSKSDEKDKTSVQEEPVPFGDSEEIIDGATNCARPGLFRHPNFCNKFYACQWDEWKKKFTLHVFNCPVHLTFDNGANACNWPSMGPACQDDNLLV